MNLFPLVFALGAILFGALIVFFWPGMDPDFKRMLIAIVCVVCIICIVAVFWPLFAGHSMTVGTH